MPLRKVPVDGFLHNEILLSLLALNSAFCMQEEVSSFNGDSFFEFVKLFTSHSHNLTLGWRHDLLTYDAFRLRITLKVLNHLRAHKVVLDALPSHTNGKEIPVFNR